MTREEMLSKDDALIELTKAVQKLPITTLTVVVHGQQQILTLVNRFDVLQLIPRFGFNDEPYRGAPPTPETRIYDQRPCMHSVGLTTCGYPEDACMHEGSPDPTVPLVGRHAYTVGPETTAPPTPKTKE